MGETLTPDEPRHDIDLASAELTDVRHVLWELVVNLRNKPKSRGVSLAITKIEEARFWIGDSMFGGSGPQP